MNQTKCSICLDERLPEIAAALAAGAQQKTVAAQFALSRSALQRHCRNCGQKFDLPRETTKRQFLNELKRAIKEVEVERQKATAQNDMERAHELLKVRMRLISRRSKLIPGRVAAAEKPLTPEAEFARMLDDTRIGLRGPIKIAMIYDSKDLGENNEGMTMIPGDAIVVFEGGNVSNEIRPLRACIDEVRAADVRIRIEYIDRRPVPNKIVDPLAPKNAKD